MAKSHMIALTGATGFVGRRMLQALLDAGYQVRALVRAPDTVAAITHPKLQWYKGALGDNDAAFVQDADCVLHIAGVIKARRRADYFAVNADAAGHLAAAAHAAGVTRVILLSSITARQPDLSDYAASKAAGEAAVKSAFLGPLAIIRAPAVFGPGDIATQPFFEAIARGILPVPGGRGWRERVLSMVFVDDLIKDIIARAVSGTSDGTTRSPATICRVTWPDFAKLCTQSLPRPVKAVPLPLPALYSVAAATSATSRLFGLGHLTLGKLREFLYDDWSSDDRIDDATPFPEALAITAAAYRSTARTT